jgi:hypothetical protein
MVDFGILTSLAVTLQTAGVDVTGPVSVTLNEFGQRVGAALPNIFAALILLGIGYVIGKVVGWVLSKFITKSNLDTTMNKTGLGQMTARSGWSFGRIIPIAVKWFIYLFFIAAAIDVLQFEQLSGVMSTIWVWIPNVIAVIVILVIGAVIADFVGGWLRRELTARQIPGGNLIGLAATGVLYAIVIIIALTQLQIGSGVLNTVVAAFAWGIAAALAIGVGVGLAYGLRELIPSVITGSTNVESTLKPGQKIRVGKYAGTVEQAGAFNIILRSEEGLVVLPTKILIDKEIVIESGPSPEIPERRLLRLAEEREKEMKQGKPTVPLGT